VAEEPEPDIEEEGGVQYMDYDFQDLGDEMVVDHSCKQYSLLLYYAS